MKHLIIFSFFLRFAQSYVECNYSNYTCIHDPNCFPDKCPSENWDTDIELTKTTSLPHIILFVSDDQGWSNVGYHNSTANTPNIDALAKNGIRLEKHYSYPLCAPSRTSLLTGRYFHNIESSIILCSDTSKKTGCTYYEHYIPRGLPTIANTLKNVGYTTYHVGKWGVGSSATWMLPSKRGFDYSFGFLKDHNHYFAHKIYNHACSGLDAWNHSKNNSRHVSFMGYRPYVHRDEALRYIQKHSASAPMFMYIATQTMHPPMEIPTELRTRNMSKRQVGDVMTKITDDFVGSVVSALKKKSMWSSTLFVYLSDNGGNDMANNAPLKGGKGQMFEGGIRTPALVSGGLAVIRTHKSSIRSGLFQISDWYKTLSRVAGIKVNGDGVDHWDYIIGNSKHSLRKQSLLLKTNGGTVIEKDLKYIEYNRCTRRVNTQCIEYEPEVGFFNISIDPTESHSNLNLNFSTLKYENLLNHTKQRIEERFLNLHRCTQYVKKTGFIGPYI